MRTTISFWTGFAASLCAIHHRVHAAASVAGKADRPNIVVIVSDDMGYSDTAFQGGKEIPTPNLDALAQGGVRFTNGYVSCPVCSPTRAGIMTGRYQQRFGHELNPAVPARVQPNFGLPLTESTLPQLLKAAGYHTGMVGKWHLGVRPGYLPMDRGFESYFGFPHGSHSYIDAVADPRNPVYRNREAIDEKEYLTDAFAREAVAYVDQHAKEKEPFFLYLTFNAVHSPLQAPEKYLKRFESIADPRHRTYAAMLSAMDDAIGKVIDALKEQKILDNTMVVFVNDNGGPTRDNTSSNLPLKGFKTQVWEGGIRVPFLMHYPGVIPAGKTYDAPVISLDILPTCLALAGAAPPKDKPLDGVDLMPFVTGKSQESPHETLYWRYGAQAAIRMGDWKLVQLPGEPPHLYNLANDLSEAHDVSDQHPDKVKTFQSVYAKWNAQLIPPLWGREAAASRPASRPARPRPRVR